jgi:hypothetical protein
VANSSSPCAPSLEQGTVALPDFALGLKDFVESTPS